MMKLSMAPLEKITSDDWMSLVDQEKEKECVSSSSNSEDQESVNEEVFTKEVGLGRNRRRSLVEKRKHVHRLSVTDLDITGLPSKSGYLRKQNRKGRWNKRFFSINNAYFNYNNNHRWKESISASIDLRTVSHVCILVRNGKPSNKFAIQLKMGFSNEEEAFFLRASTPTEAASWVASLNTRIQYYQHQEKIQPQATTPTEPSVEPASPTGGSSSSSSSLSKGKSTLPRQGSGDKVGSDQWWDETVISDNDDLYDDDTVEDDEDMDDDEGFVTGDEGDWTEEEQSAGRMLAHHPNMLNKVGNINTTPECKLPFKMWNEPSVRKLNVRGASYLKDKKKQVASEPMFKLFALDYFETNDRLDHIASLQSNRIAQALKRGEKLPFLFVINLQIPGPPFFSFVLYYAVTEKFQKILSSKTEDHEKVAAEANVPRGLPELAKRFFFSDEDDLRDKRFKLVPRIVEGPYIVRKSVGSKPACIGTKLKQRYFRHPSYLELDVDIGASIVAWKLTQLALGYAKLLTVDLAFVLQGNSEEELPEQVIGIMRAKHPDFSKAPKLDAPPAK